MTSAALLALMTFPFPCPNCDRRITTTRLFCSDLCEDEAAFVRYSRACLRDGRVERPDIREALTIRLAFLVTGGYPERRRRLPDDMRQLVIARDHGGCCNCGAPGTQIDHISGSANDPTNLQLLCAPCHNKKTMQSFVPITPASQEWAARERLLFRVHARRPERACDDAIWKDLSRRIRSARCKYMAEVKQRRSGKKCPVCLAPLKKTPRGEYLLTRIKRLAHCITCRAAPSGTACIHCGGTTVWENEEAAACQSCGAHRTKLKAITP